MNRIRAIVSGEGLAAPSPVLSKKKQAASADAGSLAGIAIKREQSRQIDQRREDRHSKLAERATLILESGEIDVAVINVSPEGVMIEGDIAEPVIGELAGIRFADCEPSQCEIRWIRGNRIGLEFTPETSIVGSRKAQDFIIRKLRRDADAADENDSTGGSRPARHRLVWTGTIYYDGESTPARIRDISAHGSMIEIAWDFHIGTEVMMDLDGAGTVSATVRWCRGGQIGLKFNNRFDLKALAKARPVEAPSEQKTWDAPIGATSIPFIQEQKKLPERGVKLSPAQVAELYGRSLTRR